MPTGSAFAIGSSRAIATAKFFFSRRDRPVAPSATQAQVTRIKNPKIGING